MAAETIIFQYSHEVVLICEFRFNNIAFPKIEVYVKKLIFQDSKKFYNELKSALDGGEEVEVRTDYKRFSDMPKELKDIFELEKHRSGTWVNLVSGAFIAGSVAAAGLNLAPLYVIGCSSVGFIIGMFGGPLFGAVGSGVGAIVGVAAAALDAESAEVLEKIKQSLGAVKGAVK